MSTSGKVSCSPSTFDCRIDHPQCRWWLRRQRQDQRFVVCPSQHSIFVDFASVDENLFYKGVDKRAVHGARLHQTHSVEKGNAIPTQSEANDPGHPPYPFESGNSLLALTEKHNVRFVGSILRTPST